MTIKRRLLITAVLVAISILISGCSRTAKGFGGLLKGIGTDIQYMADGHDEQAEKYNAEKYSQY